MKIMQKFDLERHWWIFEPWKFCHSRTRAYSISVTRLQIKIFSRWCQRAILCMAITVRAKIHFCSILPTSDHQWPILYYFCDAHVLCYKLLTESGPMMHLREKKFSQKIDFHIFFIFRQKTDFLRRWVITWPYSGHIL